jgi:hypothetical protein
MVGHSIEWSKETEYASAEPLLVSKLPKAQSVHCGYDCCVTPSQPVSGSSATCWGDLWIVKSANATTWGVGLGEPASPYTCAQQGPATLSAASGSRACAMDAAGRIDCEAEDDSGSRWFRAPEPGLELAFDPYNDFLCSLGTTGSVYCSVPAGVAHTHQSEIELGKTPTVSASPEANPQPFRCPGEKLEKLEGISRVQKLATVGGDGMVACALDASGDVWCWENRDLPNRHANRTPRKLEKLKGARWIGAGYAIDAAGKLVPLGNAPPIESFPPLVTASASEAVCGITARGHVYCGGSNVTGEGGQGEPLYREEAGDVVGLP